MKIKKIFRRLFIIGLILVVISLCLDWYMFQAVNVVGNQVVYWCYSPLFDWYTIFTAEQMENMSYKPQNSSIPFPLTVVFIVSVALSLFGAMFKDIEKETPFQKLKLYAYTHIFTILFTAFYIFIYPIWYLFPNELYFPFVQLYDPFLEYQFFYSIHIGYILQFVGFILLFPYSIFFYQTLHSFEKESQSPENVITRYIEQVQEPLDFDKYIKEEELTLESQKKKHY
ncbi:MAG: hypothetical protein ACFFDX_06590 [Candidatus Odinarchaeota archaeon]